MLFDINSIVEGRYYPGTFILGIDKSFYEGMRYDSFSRAEMATLTHEYIHYLQDISTLQGLQRKPIFHSIKGVNVKMRITL